MGPLSKSGVPWAPLCPSPNYSLAVAVFSWSVNIRAQLRILWLAVLCRRSGSNDIVIVGIAGANGRTGQAGENWRAEGALI